MRDYWLAQRRRSNAYVVMSVFTFMLFIVLGFVGWVMNLIKLLTIESNEFTIEVLIRLIGVFSPLGAVTGYL